MSGTAARVLRAVLGFEGMSSQSTEVRESFGTMLRELRERAGLTQEELAERAGLTAYAVSALERGRRNRPYPHTVRSLATALGVTDQERVRLVSAVPRRATTGEAAVTDPSPEARRAPHQPAPVPVPATRLLGRDQDVVAVTALLMEEGQRLVTLTGTGGVGKTRLASAVAAGLDGSFPDGVVVVPLAPLTDAVSVLPAIARAVGASSTEGPGLPDVLVEHLRELRLLLVLDNLERLLDASEQVADLVAACPALAVLVTSRAPMRVRGEVEHPVPPLGLPHRTDVAAVGGSAAGAVFLERARAVSPSFVLTPGNAQAVAEICRRLAGIPLALELAASRVRFLDPKALLERLDDAMARAGGRDLPARQQTMRATFDWSYDLLSPEEQRLLLRLSVFHGGCTLDAVEAVHDGDEEVLGVLEALVEHSLLTVRADEEGRVRFGLLEPVAQYAVGRMTPEQLAAARDAHAACYRAWAERAAPEYQAGDQVVWLDRSEREDANLNAAINWAVASGDGETAGRIGWSLWLYWWLRGRLAQGRRLMEQALPLEMPRLVRTRTQLTIACMSFSLGDLETAGSGWSAAEELSRQGGDGISKAGGIAGTGLVDLASGRLDSAQDCFVRALPHCEDQGIYGDWLQSLIWVWLGTVQLLQGDVDGAQEQARRGLASARRRGDRLTAYVALFNLSQVAIAQGRLDAAKEHLHEGIRLTQETGDLANLAYFLEALAVVEHERGNSQRVGVLLGAAETAREAVGGQVYGYYVPDEQLRKRCIEASRAVLGPDVYDDTLDAGRSLTPHEAITYALTDAPEESATCSPTVRALSG